MPGTRQVGQPLDQGVTLQPPKNEWHSTTIYDHQGRPFQSVWKGDRARRPRFSWQVYTTMDVDENSVDVGKFLGGLEIAEYEATFDIYAPLPSTYACISHQKLERRHRKDNALDQSHAVTIPECYGSDLHLGGFIIVIGTPEWKSEGYGPLFVTFDIRPPSLAVVEPGLNAADAGIFEQIELKLRRQRQPQNLGLDLRTVYTQSGGYDWELSNAEALKELSASPKARSADYPAEDWASVEDLAVQSSHHESGLNNVQVRSGTTKETTNMTYSVYITFSTAQNSDFSLEDTARSFTAAIVSQLPAPVPSVSFEFFGPLPNIGSCISHNRSHAPPSTGYLYPGSEKRRYPLHGIEAAGAAYVEEPDHRKFLVVLDKSDWAHDEGVLFVWDDLRPQPEDLLSQSSDEAFAGRLPGLKIAAERLAGLL